jgi:hypothetical protein
LLRRASGFVQISITLINPLEYGEGTINGVATRSPTRILAKKRRKLVLTPSRQLTALALKLRPLTLRENDCKHNPAKAFWMKSTRSLMK